MGREERIESLREDGEIKKIKKERRRRRNKENEIVRGG